MPNAIAAAPMRVGTGTDEDGNLYAVTLVQDRVYAITRVVEDRRVAAYGFGGHMTFKLLGIAGSARYDVRPPQTTAEARMRARVDAMRRQRMAT